MLKLRCRLLWWYNSDFCSGSSRLEFRMALYIYIYIYIYTILNNSQPYISPRPVTGIVFLCMYEVVFIISSRGAAICTAVVGA
jgi:hypothetical protein